MVDDGRDPLGVAIRLGRHVRGPALEAAREIPDPLAHGIRFTR